MQRMLLLVLAAVLLPATVSAEDDTDLGSWPSPTELRRELQSIGFDFGYLADTWVGGRYPADGGTDTIWIEGGTDDEVMIGVGMDDGTEGGWPGAIASGLTATREVFASIGIPRPLQEDIINGLPDEIRECTAWEVPGGTVVARRSDNDEIYKGWWPVEVVVAEGRHDCEGIYGDDERG